MSSRWTVIKGKSSTSDGRSEDCGSQLLELALSVAFSEFVSTDPDTKCCSSITDIKL